jgi:hypothetical protein
MPPLMKILPAVAMVLASPYASAVWDMPPDTFLANMDATAKVCEKLDPQGVRRAVAAVNKEYDPSKRAQLRATPNYKAAFAEAAARLQALPLKERTSTCKRAW